MTDPLPVQLRLPLPTRPALGREDYFVGKANGLAVALVDNWRNWPSGKLILVGPEGAGKTHLAHVWASESGATILPATMLGQVPVPELAEGPVCIENVPAIAGDRPLEEELFHLHNLALAQGQPLMMTADRAPGLWPLLVPDLKSRMEGTQTATLPEPDDQLLAAVLVKLFADRQTVPAPDVIPYLLRHMPRSFAMAQQAAKALDSMALGRPRGVTRALAIRALAELSERPGGETA